MPETVELDDLLENNPHIDREKLQESMELLEALRGYGVRGRGYGLVPTFGGRRVQTVERSSDDEDPRTIHLHRT